MLYPMFSAITHLDLLDNLSSTFYHVLLSWSYVSIASAKCFLSSVVPFPIFMPASSISTKSLCPALDNAHRPTIEQWVVLQTKMSLDCEHRSPMNIHFSLCSSNPGMLRSILLVSAQHHIPLIRQWPVGLINPSDIPKIQLLSYSINIRRRPRSFTVIPVPDLWPRRPRHPHLP